MIPNVMASCWRATKLPRTSGGAISALYRGTAILKEPTPIPVTNLPASELRKRLAPPLTSYTSINVRRILSSSLNDDANDENHNSWSNLVQSAWCQESLIDWPSTIVYFRESLSAKYPGIMKIRPKACPSWATITCHQNTKPCPQFKDGYQPSFCPRIIHGRRHPVVKGRHAVRLSDALDEVNLPYIRKNTWKDTLRDMVSKQGSR